VVRWEKIETSLKAEVPQEGAISFIFIDGKLPFTGADQSLGLKRCPASEIRGC